MLALLLIILPGCATYLSGIEVQADSLIVFKRSDESKSTVIIAHGCDGLSRNPAYPQWGKLIAAWGYNAVMIDSFAPRGYAAGVCTRGYLVPPETRAHDMLKVASYVARQPWHKGKIAVIGFSHGGSTVLNLASNPERKGIDAAIAYYPGCSGQFVGRSYANPPIPVQLHLGGKDDWTPPSQCQNLAGYESYLYLDATHAFDMNLRDRVVYGYTLRYDKAADELSKARVKAFLEKYLR